MYNSFIIFYIENNIFSDLYCFEIYLIIIIVIISVDVIITPIFIKLDEVNLSQNTLLSISTWLMIGMADRVIVIFGVINSKNIGIIVSILIGVNELWASLYDLDILAIAIHTPLINIKYIIIINNPNDMVIMLKLNIASLYISNMFWHILKDVIDNIMLIIDVIMQDIVIAKYFPLIISLLLIGNVKNVSNVPRSFSPAVESTAQYIATKVIDIIPKINADEIMEFVRSFFPSKLEYV